MPTSNFQPIRLLDPSSYKFKYLMTNSADPDQFASLEANSSGATLFAKAGYIRVSRTRANFYETNKSFLLTRTCYLYELCVEVLRPSQPNGVMSSTVSLPDHTFTGQA